MWLYLLTCGDMEPMAALTASPGVTDQEAPKNLTTLAVQTDEQFQRMRDRLGPAGLEQYCQSMMGGKRSPGCMRSSAYVPVASDGEKEFAPGWVSFCEVMQSIPITEGSAGRTDCATYGPQFHVNVATHLYVMTTHCHLMGYYSCHHTRRIR